MEVLTMFGKNRNKKVGICVMVVTASLVLAGLWAVLAAPETALADKKTGGGKKGSGQGALHGCITLRDAGGDGVQSDWFATDATPGDNPYCDGFDNTTVGLLEFFRFSMRVKKNVAGRRLVLDFTGFTDQDAVNSCLPADKNVWKLGVKGTLDDWRAQGDTEDNPQLRNGNLHFGKTGKDEANVSFGKFDVGHPLTVTRIDIDEDGSLDDAWTIESFPDDTAVLWRDLVDGIAVPCASGSMPFLVTYDGREPSP